MTRDEALALKSFTHICNCGGHAHSMNGRPESDPHMLWCPQREEYRAWYDTIHSQEKANG